MCEKISADVKFNVYNTSGGPNTHPIQNDPSNTACSHYFWELTSDAVTIFCWHIFKAQPHIQLINRQFIKIFFSFKEEFTKYYNIGYLCLYMHGYGYIERDKDSGYELPREALAS